ncbi:MAG: hypothetical protein ACOZCK_01880 [Pseudomonadota bacterium]
MADQEHIKPLTEQAERDAFNEASLALGKAWGLAQTMCALMDERPDDVVIESIMRTIRQFVVVAYGKAQSREAVRMDVGAALDTCDLVMIDSQEAEYKPGSPAMWALEAIPDIIQHAKDAVDAIPWGLPQLKAA